MSWKKHFRPANSVLPTQMTSSSAASAISKFSSWLPEVYAGPPNRLQRYAQYDQMDLDHEVHTCLDTISEFATNPNPDTKLPFDFDFTEEPSATELKILNDSLRQWCNINEFQKRAFNIFRSATKYGDQIFIRDPETYKLIWIDPQTVERVVVNESEGKKPEVYYIKNLDLNLQNLVGTDVSRKVAGGYGSADSIFPNAPLTGQANFIHGSSSPSMTSGGQYGGQEVTFPIDAEHIVHLSLTTGMDDAWPFGISQLEKIFKVYKQKELLEDAILIYRVHRAPERRVFMIDTGTMPPQKAQQYLERVRYEVQQKRIPSRTGGGQNIMDSSYNPLSQLEDYFFAQTSDGRGSKVDVLKGGENLGQIDDLRLWNNKMARALGIPSSYLITGPEDGTSHYSDGRIGDAFIQEFRFSMSLKRLQTQLIDPLDLEFKLFLKHRDINIDSSLFKVVFNEPQNFSEYRQIEIDSAYASVYAQVSEIPFLSKRYALKRYLGWKDQDLIENERMWKEEQADGVPGSTGGNSTAGGIGGMGGIGGSGDMREVGVNPGDFDEFEDPDTLDDEVGDDLETDTNAMDSLGDDLDSV